MIMNNVKNPRGSGRKPANPLLKKNPINLKLEQYILDWLAGQEKSRAIIIASALRDKYGIKPPV
jgi:hypothetical protein